ncbi:MAG TPA: HemK/PrmC family methyltransferase, partial [Trichocoleus sp.]
MTQDIAAQDIVARTRYGHEVSGLALWQWWQTARQQAQTAGIDPAEADWVLYALSNVDGLTLKLGRLREQPKVAARVSLAELTELWRRRVEERVPVQYLVGSTRWRNLTIRVSPAVLIPRPETELIVDLALEAAGRSSVAEQLQQGIWVDLGTGSGAIALGLAQAFPKAKIYAVDISEAALAIARENAALNGLAERIEFRCGSWFEPLED